MQAKDIMTVNVISVSEDLLVHEIVSLLLKYRISAVPVIDSARKVVGIVSEGDLLRPEAANRRRNAASVVAGGGLRRPAGRLRKGTWPHRWRGDDPKRDYRGRKHPAQ